MKTVVIGVGRMGRRHVQVVKDMGLDLVGVADPRPESLELVEKEQGVSKDKHFTDAKAMIQATKPELVVIATTAPTHCDLTCLAAESGAKYVLCEKPMAVSLDECDRMLAACEANGTRLAINHQMRFMEQYTLVKDIVQSEAFGSLGSVNVLAGNFGMAMNGTHYFEMFRYMTDEAPVEAAAWFTSDPLPNPRGPEFEDRAGQVRLVSASGVRYYMDIGADQGHGMQVVYMGRNGRITVDELGGKMWSAIRKAEHSDAPTTRYGMPWTDEERAIAPADAVTPTRHVLEAMLKGENWPTGEDGRLAVAALVAAYVSNENGHVPVKIDGNLPTDRVFPWA